MTEQIIGLISYEMHVFLFQKRLIKRIFLTWSTGNHKLIVGKIIANRKHNFEHFRDFLLSASRKQRNDRFVLEVVFFDEFVLRNVFSAVNGINKRMPHKFYREIVFCFVKIFFERKN